MNHSQRPALIAPLLAGLSMFGPFAIDTMFPAFAQMQAQFAVDAVAIQQTLSVYMLAFALMSVVHGPLSDAVGRRKVLLGGVGLFTLASVGCALSPDLPTLLAFRALQGLSAGVGMIVGRAVIRDLYHGDDAQRLMSQVSIIFGIAPAIAPIVGGWLLAAGRWPLIFWFLTGFGALLWLATATLLPETHPPASRQPLAPRKWVADYWRIAGNPRFLRLAFAGSLGFSTFFLYIASAPAVVMGLLGLGERDFGWLFIPAVGGMTAGAFISGRFAGRISGHVQCRMGYAAAMLGVALMVAYAWLSPVYEVPWAVLPLFLCGVGIGMVYPILSLAILDMYPTMRGSASSMQVFIQLMSHTVVAGVVSPLLSHDALWLALGSAACCLSGWALWRLEVRAGRRIPDSRPAEEPLEPTDGM